MIEQGFEAWKAAGKIFFSNRNMQNFRQKGTRGVVGFRDSLSRNLYNSSNLSRHSIMKRLVVLGCALFLFASVESGVAQTRLKNEADGVIAQPILMQIIRAEDQRRWDDHLKSLLAHENAKVRKRAVLAAGRIGNQDAVALLADRVLTDSDVDVRQTAAFALGEIELGGGAYALTEV
ncbi:MAG TPA: HEAT repeat domain-containing protein, partial [Pyrinomonadaceae bacterium]|nr:HEAT repeat domain-containing protein [Pyrinomonadaceae bacterium]